MQYQNYQNFNQPFGTENSPYNQRSSFTKKKKSGRLKGLTSGTGYYTVLVLLLLYLIQKCIGNAFFLLNAMQVNVYDDEVFTLIITCIGLFWSLILAIITIVLLCIEP